MPPVTRRYRLARRVQPWPLGTDAPRVRLTVIEIAALAVIALLVLWGVLSEPTIARGETIHKGSMYEGSMYEGSMHGPRMPVLHIKPDATCHLVGDSIAEGLVRLLPECSAHARIGATSHAIIAWTQPTATEVISAGSNDIETEQASPQQVAALRRDLEAIRAHALAFHYVWILPSHKGARAVVAAVARAHNDATVRFTPGGSRGQAFVHPGNYAALAAAIRKVLK